VASSNPARRKLLIVVNPHATSVDRRLRSLVIAALGSRYEVEAVDTKAPGHARELARAAVSSGTDAVATLGGDGTLNEAADALAGSGIALYPLPGGSQNVFAKLLGLPSEIVDSTARLLETVDKWQTRQVDLGRANGRAFSFSAGVGLDASVVEHVDSNPDRKARLKQWYYVQSGISEYLKGYALRRPRLTVDSGTEEIQCDTVLIQNGTYFTFAGDRAISLCEGVSLDSGQLGAALLHLRSPVRAALTASRLLASSATPSGGTITQLRSITGLRARAHDGHELPLQVDGDFAGMHSKVEITIEPQVLTVLAPPATSLG
jgi:diacylglycerol kinase family enzyme